MGRKSKLAYHKATSCENKVAWLTKEDADARVDQVRRRKGEFDTMNLVSYSCSYCPAWHIGNKNKWKW